MLFSAIFAVAAASLAGVAQAQNSTYPYTVAPGSVPISQRYDWCNQQRSSCGQLCNGNAPTNMCDPVRPFLRLIDVMRELTVPSRPHCNTRALAQTTPCPT